MPPKSGPGEDQTKFSDEELGIKVPVEKTDEKELGYVPAPLEVTPDGVEQSDVVLDATEKTEGTEKKTISRNTAYEIVTESRISEPVPGHGREETITLLAFLEREFEASWHTLYSTPKGRDLIETTTHTLMNRFESPEGILALGEAFRINYLSEKQEKIDAINEELDKLEERNDRAAAYKKQSLIKDREDLTVELMHRKRTGNEIASYLTELAEDWQRKLEKKGK